MRYKIVTVLFTLSIHSFLFSQLQPGDEHWKQFTQIQNGEYVASCQYNGIVYACFHIDSPSTIYNPNDYSDYFIVYEITEDTINVFCNISIDQELGSDCQHKEITSITFFKNELIIAGTFKRVNDNVALGCARYNGKAWRSLGLGIEGSVKECIAIDNDLYFWGLITKAGGRTAHNFIKWDGTNWITLQDINCESVKADCNSPRTQYYSLDNMTHHDNFIDATCTIINSYSGSNYVYVCKDSKYYPGLVRYSINENRWYQVIQFAFPKDNRFQKANQSKASFNIYGIDSYLITKDGFSIFWYNFLLQLQNVKGAISGNAVPIEK
jgi:hypothetical protein